MSSRNPPPWRRDDRSSQRPAPASTVPAKRSTDSRPHDHPSKRSTTAQEEAWVADEDRFVLQQAKKRAALRVKGGRAKPIDWLAVTLRFVDTTKNLLDEEVENHELEVVDPEGVFEGLSEDDLSDLEKEIDNYLTLETSRSNRDYWTVSGLSSLLVEMLTSAGSQSDMQRSATQVTRYRSPGHKLRFRRYRSFVSPQNTRAIGDTGSASKEKAGFGRTYRL